MSQNSTRVNMSIFIVHFIFLAVYKAKCLIDTASDTDGYFNYSRVNFNYTLYTQSISIITMTAKFIRVTKSNSQDFAYRLTKGFIQFFSKTFIILIANQFNTYCAIIVSI